MSSMGDIIHTLPAITDAKQAIPDLQIDWVVEPAFLDIPTWHPAVKNIIPMALRKWRKNILDSYRSREITHFLHTLKEKKYDAIIDAQGLLKSAIVTKIARGESHGYDKHSTREFISSYFYTHTYSVNKAEHAITRTRELFSKALHYDLPNTRPNFQIDTSKLPTLNFELENHYFVFLHGTTWSTKHYPESYWKQLLEKTNAQKIRVYLLWGNDQEKKRAENFAENFAYVTVLPKLSITQIATVLKNAAAVVSVDTGLGHLSAALSTPTIGLYGPTDANRLGVMGDNQLHLQAHFPCAPCYSKICHYAKKHKTDIVPACYTTIDPNKVWEVLVR